MNSNSNNNNVGVGGGCVIKHLNCKSTSQESTDADRKIQKKQEKIAKYSLKAERIQQKQKDLQKKFTEYMLDDPELTTKMQEAQREYGQYKLDAEIIQEKIEKLQQLIALDKTKEKIRIQEKEKKIQEKEEKEDLKTLKKISQKYHLNCNTHIEFLETAFQNRENPYICMYKGHLLIGTYTIDDKNNITFLDNEGHPCTPSGFAVEHMRNINKILNCSPETTSTNGWDTCEIVNEEGEWVKLATLRPPKSDDDA